MPTTRRRWLLAAGSAAFLAAAIVVSATAASAATLFSASFEDNTIGSWSKSGGTWSVVADGSPWPASPAPRSENARLFAGSTSWTAYTVQARVKPLSLGSGGLVALLARASGSTKFYRLALLAGNQVQLQVVNGCAVTVLGSAVPDGRGRHLVHARARRQRHHASRGHSGRCRVGSGTSSLIAGRPDRLADRVLDRLLRRRRGQQRAGRRRRPRPPASARHRAPADRPRRHRAAATEPPPPTGTLFVATNGNDANPGTLAQPLRRSSARSTWWRRAARSRSAAAPTRRAPPSSCSRTARRANRSR